MVWIKNDGLWWPYSGQMLSSCQAPGDRVLYLGAASGITVSHVSDIVGPVSLLLHSCVVRVLSLVL